MKLTNDEKRANALAYLGNKHVLHKNYERGTIAPYASTDAPDVGRHLRAFNKAQKAQAKMAEETADRILKFGGRK